MAARDALLYKAMVKPRRADILHDKIPQAPTATTAYSLRNQPARPQGKPMVLGREREHKPGAAQGNRISSSLTSAGFTLIEIMAAMVIFFMVIGILVSGVSQSIRLAEFSQSSATASRDAAIRLAWFRETVGLLVTPAYSSEPQLQPNFAGNTRSLSGLTLQSLLSDSAGSGAFAWSLTFDPQTNETQLQYQAPLPKQFRLEVGAVGAVGDSKTYTAFSWSGSNGRFRYLDETGAWQDQWPAESLGLAARDTTPPMAVGLEYGNDARMLVVAIQNRSYPLPSLKELLK